MDVDQVGEVWRMCHIGCMKLADPHLGSLVLSNHNPASIRKQKYIGTRKHNSEAVGETKLIQFPPKLDKN